MKRCIWILTVGLSIITACGNPSGTVSREEATEICSRVLREQLSALEDVQESCLMLMEVRSGNVLAAVDLVVGEDGSVRADSLGGGFVRMFEPGPVFETATLAALLSDGYVRSLEDQVAIGNGVVEGTVIRDDSVLAYARNFRKDSLSVLEGFSHSYKNVFSSLLVKNYGIAGSKNRQEGIDKTERFLETVKGYFTGTADSPEPNIPTPATRYWTDTDLGSMAYGYSLELTPIHILTFYNALANGGKGAAGRICPEAVVDTLTRALKLSAKAVFETPIDAIAGKAGNSFLLLPNHQYEDAEGRHRIQRTFAGFFPADDPQFSFICVAYYRLGRVFWPTMDLPTKTIQALYPEVKRTQKRTNHE